MMPGTKMQWEILDTLCHRPSLFAETPDAAHGMFIACAAMILAESRGIDIWPAVSEVRVLVQEVAKNVSKAPENVLTLGTEQMIPTRIVSWPEFIRQATILASMLPRESTNAARNHATNL